MIVYKSYSEIDKEQWNELMQISPTTTFFQTRECYDFYASLSFLKPFVFGVSENNKLVGVICGYIISEGNFIKRYFSRRAIVPGGALLEKNISPKVLNALLDCTIQVLNKKVIYIELRNFNDYGAFRQHIETSGFAYQSHFDIQVETNNEKVILQKLSESKRRQLKTSQNAGVEWIETKQYDDIKAFYKILVNLYRLKVKTPLFPLEFFEKLVEQPNGKLLVVKYKNQVIGGMACVILENKILYEWFVCGEERDEKDIFSSVVATWAGIDYAVKNMIPLFDFMGAGSPEKDYGVREFKRKFGGKMLEQGRFLFICKPILYKLGKWIVERIKE
ncbi:MAG: peptidoglycan bridge formation glycyltransferase FemA/FemB family protein [Paludibacter sp.]